VHCKAVLYIMQLHGGFCLWSLGFSPRWPHVRFVAYKLTLELISKFYLLLIAILPLLHTLRNCVADLLPCMFRVLSLRPALCCLHCEEFNEMCVWCVSLVHSVSNVFLFSFYSDFANHLVLSWQKVKCALYHSYAWCTVTFVLMFSVSVVSYW